MGSSRNAAALAQAPHLKQREIQSLSPDDVRRFLAAIRTHRHAALFTVAVSTGMRRESSSRCDGLTWLSRR
jgi:integrase